MFNFKDRLRTSNKLVRMYERELETAKMDFDNVYIKLIESKLAKAIKNRNLLLTGKP